jgi:Arc/MetJ-type ribon-helix-helix transcriptional regulator
MQIQLSGKAAKVVEAQVTSGIYPNASDFISDIILKYEAYYKKKIETLNKEIAIGIKQANKGECVEFDFDELMQEIDEELGYTNNK